MDDDGPSRPMVTTGYVNFGLAKETFWASLMSGCGLVAAGLLMAYFMATTVFVECKALVLMIPVLLGVKCCLEYTLASRLSTSANKGELDDHGSAVLRHQVLRSNIGVATSQALVAALLASIAAMGIQSWFVAPTSDTVSFWRDAAIVFSTAVITAFLAAFLLGLVASMIIILSRQRSVDPDNIAGPLVTGFGDALTVLLLGVTAQVAYWLPYLTLVAAIGLLLLLPVTMDFAREHPISEEALNSGWTPILFVLVLSLAGGIFLEGDADAVGGGLPTLVPLLNGIGGNMGSVYASRFGTALHQGRAHASARFHFQTSLTLTAITPLIHTCFILPLTWISSVFGWDASGLTWVNMSVLLVLTTAQVALLMAVGKSLVRRAWGRNLNPDDHVIPYLSACSDLMGILIIHSLITFNFNLF